MKTRQHGSSTYRIRACLTIVVALVLVGWLAGCGNQTDRANHESIGSARQALSCTSYPEWTITTYVGGDRVKHVGNAYECKPFPYNGWCGQSGYEPGVTLYWQDAWIPLGACDGPTDASSDGLADAGDATGSGGSSSDAESSSCPAPVPPPLPDPTCVDGNCCPQGSQVITLSPNPDTFSNNTAGVCVVALGGNDTLSSAAPGVTIVAGDGNDTISAGQLPAGTEPVRIYAGGGNDTVNGWFDHAEIFAGPGDDVIAAGPGPVLLAPGSGADVVSSGDGDDTYILYAECEATPNKNLDAQGGYDTLISPLTIDELRARNITVNGFENVIINRSPGRAGGIPDVSRSKRLDLWAAHERPGEPPEGGGA